MTAEKLPPSRNGQPWRRTALAGWLAEARHIRVFLDNGKPQLRPPQCDAIITPEGMFLVRRAQEAEQDEATACSLTHVLLTSLFEFEYLWLCYPYVQTALLCSSSIILYSSSYGFITLSPFKLNANRKPPRHIPATDKNERHEGYQPFSRKCFCILCI